MKLSFISAACVLSFSALMSAHAAPLVIGGSVTVENKSGNAFTSTTITNGLYTNVAFMLNGTTPGSASAGLFVLDQKPASSPDETGSWSQLLAFCLEPDVLLTPFNNPYAVKSVGGAGYTAAVSSAISELWGRYYGTWNAGENRGQMAAAFQVALWELAYDTTAVMSPPNLTSLSNGAFVLTSAGTVKDTAQGWLNSLNGTGPMAQRLLVLQDTETRTNKQDLLTQGQVPEPGMLGLLAAGLAGLGLARRRARRNNQA
jgi:hypothetical protein